MIPKIIHYCWFGGGELPEKDKKCIESWKKFCPDYEIIRWDESNYNVRKNQYMYEAYKAKKWGFVPDFARLDIVYNYGGIYLDTDVEIIRNMDDLLENKAYMGFESICSVAPGLGFGAEKNNPLIYEIMHSIYDNRHFLKGKDEFDTTPSPVFQTQFLQTKGLVLNGMQQNIEGLLVLPVEYLCPKDYETDILHITERTFSIHHFHASWVSQEKKNEKIRERKFIEIFGRKGKVLAKIVNFPIKIQIKIKQKGIIGSLCFIFNKFFGK